jgi:hypothetical protein
MEPQVNQSGGSWTARYPGADWSVSDSTRELALQRLREEFIRRQNAGDDPLDYADEIFRRHLQDPVPEVYAVDNELYRELVHAPEEYRDRAVREANADAYWGRPTPRTTTYGTAPSGDVSAAGAGRRVGSHASAMPYGPTMTPGTS